MLMDMFYSANDGIVKHRRSYHFHEKLWKSQVEEKSLLSSISSWIMNLPFDTEVKEWLAAEERDKQGIQMKNILPTVVDKFLKLGCHNCNTFDLFRINCIEIARCMEYIVIE
ncbi:hypothetical protein I3842_08G051200 [Carya illinoinensis]|uniref:Uncharacterized protein n=1 Tax=Carya illinoinensis TaxID=32201 RepID=A0A922E9J2_CARIL|nr:hypothetical protein I3842_08G051200 [Carya illinoinensis]